jgi:hypothetical protein
MTPYLTKSRFLAGRQCKKLLWYRVFDKDSIPEVTLGQEAIFDQGDEVGELARKCFPSGVLVTQETTAKNVAQTAELLPKRVPLFESGFRFDDVYCRTDILLPNADGSWDLVEVKSGTRVKENKVYLWDVAFQYYCLKRCGIDVRKCYLMLVDREYVCEGKLDVTAFFKREDVTGEAFLLLDDVERGIAEMTAFFAETTCPSVDIGEHCDKPYECPMKGVCWAHIPAHSVFNLHRMKTAKKFALYREGIIAVTDVPPDRLSDKQLIQYEAERSGEPYVDQGVIRDFLNTLIYPTYYMDFETVFPVIPLQDGLRPFDHLVFQYSVHVQRTPGGELMHHEFLAEGTDDPRRAFIEGLLRDVGNAGTVMVYNAPFEGGRLKELAEIFPEYAAQIKSLLKRIVDLYVPFRSMAYYHPDQNGSTSIKKVLPALTGKGYLGMDIANAGDACTKYFFGVYKNDERFPKETLFSALREYCGLDTKAMAMIVDRLRELIGM